MRQRPELGTRKTRSVKPAMGRATASHFRYAAGSSVVGQPLWPFVDRRPQLWRYETGLFRRSTRIFRCDRIQLSVLQPMREREEALVMTLKHIRPCAQSRQPLPPKI